MRDESIILADGPRETTLIRLADVPLTHGGRVGFQVENALSATAAAWSLGISPDAIISGLESFKGEMNYSPGRFNLLEIGGATVIVDYVHNVSALGSLLEAIEAFPQERRTAVYSAPGDRRDDDLTRQAEMLGDTFDCVLLYEDRYTRGRQPGEIIGLFREGARGRDAGSPKSPTSRGRSRPSTSRSKTPRSATSCSSRPTRSTRPWTSSSASSRGNQASARSTSWRPSSPAKPFSSTAWIERILFAATRIIPEMSPLFDVTRSSEHGRKAGTSPSAFPLASSPSSRDIGAFLRGRIS